MTEGLPFDFTIKNTDEIHVTLKGSTINVTDFLALIRYMEMNKQLKKIMISGPSGYLEIKKDY